MNSSLNEHDFKGKCEMANFNNDKKLILYHGSKAGIQGVIAPISRERCDFGAGFYMGTEKTQPLTLICTNINPVLYTVELDLTGLNVLEYETGIDWALQIAYNRGKLEHVRDSALYERVSGAKEGRDVIVGDIANDRMFVVLDRFFDGLITDTALVESLSALRLGKQYVAVTQRACDRVKIIREEMISDQDLEELRSLSEANRAEGIRLADEIIRRNRRDGRYFDEIIEAEIRVI